MACAALRQGLGKIFSLVDVFADLDLVVTTSLYFIDEGGETAARQKQGSSPRLQGYWSSTTRRSEMWPGNATDVTVLDIVAERLQRRFGIRLSGCERGNDRPEAGGGDRSARLAPRRTAA